MVETRVSTVKAEMDLVTLSVPAAEIRAMKLYEKMGLKPRAYFLWKKLVE